MSSVAYPKGVQITEMGVQIKLKWVSRLFRNQCPVCSEIRKSQREKILAIDPGTRHMGAAFAVAAIYPELATLLPSDKHWMKGNYDNMFDAVAIGAVVAVRMDADRHYLFSLLIY